MSVLSFGLRRTLPSRCAGHASRRYVSLGSKTSKTPQGISSRYALPDTPARTRFAPSPTGYLHLGSLRTALFSYLLAKSTGGQFLLRIEDTDQTRTIPGAEERLMQDLEWAGLEWDEGPKVGGPYGPYKQSERTDTYQKHAHMLVDHGKAYRCFCTPKRLNDLGQWQVKNGKPVQYDRKCAHLSAEESADRASKGESHTIRLDIQESRPYDDLIFGKVKSKNTGGFSDTANAIILKSNGGATYHLANVVDDHLMKITHVIRGTEWMNSTPMHIFMYDAFGWKAPGFAHVGLLTDKEGQKLSKRHSHTDISTYRDELGIVPEVLTNFLALLGWSHQNKNDVMNLQELTNNFNMKFTKGNTVVDFGKLHYLQRQHTVRYAIAGLEGDTSKITFLTTSIEAELSKRDLDIPLSQILHGRDKNTYLLNLIKIDKRYELAPDFVARNEFYFRRPTADDLEKSSANPLNGTYATLTPPLPQAALELAAAFDPILVLGDEAWNPVVLSAHMGGIVAEMAKEKGKVELENDVDEKSRKDYVKRWATAVHEYLRWALCAGKPGPAGHEAMALLGREETLARLRAAENFLRKGPEEKIENRVDIV